MPSEVPDPVIGGMECWPVANEMTPVVVSAATNGIEWIVNALTSVIPSFR